MKILNRDIIEKVISQIISKDMINTDTKIYINPTGRFVIGGPQGDTGLTGRKIIVDTYGGYARHGGGAFSEKDPTKVNRSATYAAKNIVAARLSKKCEIQIEYPDSVIAKAVKELFNLRPEAIIKKFGLRKPIYKALASHGH